MAPNSYVLLPLAVIGAAAVLKCAYDVFNFLTFHFINPTRPLKAYKSPTRDSYALVTGASAGIGLGIAQELVRQGFGVILLGHIEDELADAAAGLEKLVSGAKVRIIVMNAITATSEEMEEAVRSVSDLRVSILVNNVGGLPIQNPPFRYYKTYSAPDVDAVINQNARFMTRFTRLVLPLLERKSNPSDRALILNISSGGMVGLTWLVMYSATKAFNWSFSAGLSRELQYNPETRHIDSLCVLPGDVLSQGNSKGVAEGTIAWDAFGREVVLRTDAAVARNVRAMSPYWKHALQKWAMDTFPEGVVTDGFNRILETKAAAWNEHWEKQR